MFAHPSIFIKEGRSVEMFPFVIHKFKCTFAFRSSVFIALPVITADNKRAQ